MDTLSLTKEARIYNGEKTISFTSRAGKTSQPLVRMKLEHFLRPYTPVFLSGEFPWTEETGGLQSIGSHRGRHE